ncbi:MAG: hypothetical protein ACI9HY_001259, partial [Planctomycetaceae bacterium]
KVPREGSKLKGSCQRVKSQRRDLVFMTLIKLGRPDQEYPFIR